MSEEKRKRSVSNQTGAYILIGLGVVFLLVNLLNINFGRLWPLILVAIGIYLLFARDGKFVSSAKTGRFRAPVDGAQTADVELHLSVGEAVVEPLTDAADLIDAELTYVGEVRFDVSGAEHKTVQLRQTADATWQWLNPGNWFGGVEQYEWRIGLNRALPLRLNIHGGMGKSELNLHDLTLTDLRLHGGAGQMLARLPASESGYDVRVEGGVGELNLDLPVATSLNIELRGGVGEMNLHTDGSTAIRLTAQGGIGDVKVPSRLVRVSGGGGDFELGKSGTWETADFETAERRILIHYEGGVGTLNVR